MGSDSDSSGGGGGGDGGGGGIRVRGLVVKALVVVGGVLLLKRLRKSTTRWDHARAVADALSGEKFSREQARRDPDSYFNIRMLTCPATEMVDGSKVLYFEQAFWRTPEKPFRQEKLWTLYLPNTIIEEVAAENRSRSERKLALNIGRNDVVVDLAATSFPRDDVAVDLAGRRFYMVKPCPKEMKCDVELSSYAIRDVEEYKNFCDRPKDQRPQPEEVIGDIAEHLTTMHLSRCERGKRCLYEGSTPPGGFPNSWNGATHCTSDVTIYKNGELHTWDKGYDDEGNQVWGPKAGPYEFKPAPQSSYDDMFSSLNFTPSLSLEKKMDSPYVINEQ